MVNKLTAAEFDEVKETVNRLVASATQEDADHCADRLKSIKHGMHEPARFQVGEVISCARQLRDARIRREEVNAALEDAKENEAFLKQTLQNEYDKLEKSYVEG